MRYSHSILILIMAIGVMGCTGGTPPTADPAAAREGLTTALTAWQNGEPVAALAKRSPAIYVADDSYHNGARLLKYEITGDGDRFGFNHCVPVQITLQDKDGNAVQ